MVKKLVLTAFLLIFALSLVVSISQEATQTENNLKKAFEEMNSLSEIGIPTTRVNESLEEANQIFSGQLILEKTGKKSDYTIVNNLIEKSLEIMETSKTASDELNVFLETYQEYEKEVDLSSMNQEYQEIILSFEEERFEDTLELIEEGYNKLSEVQSSQATLRLFYKSTSNGIKTFFVNNWMYVLGAILVGGALILFFKKTISLILIRREIKHLEFQKDSINHLIMQTQKKYFKNSNISKMEYDIKINKFENMIRDINRQIPLLKEGIAKIKKSAKEEKSKKKKSLKEADKKIEKAKDLEKEIKEKLKDAKKDLEKKVKETKKKGPVPKKKPNKTFKKTSKKKVVKKTNSKKAVKKKNSKKKVSQK